MSLPILVLGGLEDNPANSIDFERAAQQLQSYDFDVSVGWSWRIPTPR